MDAIECIKTRRSTRSFLSQNIPDSILYNIIDTATYTPSAKNCQPWKIKIINNPETINSFSKLLKHSFWIKNAPCIIIVFLDKKNSYQYIKGVQACGAFIQNILLTSNYYNIGSCWIGEICSKEKAVKQLLDISNKNLKLMGIIALGNIKRKSSTPYKRPIKEIII